MKFIGFLKEEDKNIRDGKHLDEMFTDLPIDERLRKNIIEYLSSGLFLTGVMSYIYDNEGNPIGNLDYFTDGEFIWPVYYPYYLKKYDNFLIAPKLLSHAQSNNFVIHSIDPVKLSSLCKEFEAEWAGYWKKSKNL